MNEEYRCVRCGTLGAAQERVWNGTVVRLCETCKRAVEQQTEVIESLTRHHADTE